MCGIFGISQKNESFIKNSLNLLKHRGPDDNGFFISKKLSLGHVRLSILDISKAGNQPMFYNNKKLIIVFNGEIYNFLEIKKELLNKGYKFKTNTDTEVILASYMEWGENCVKRFSGMWSFAIYDKRKDILFLSRDRFGKKPLYIYNFEGLFAFSSELKSFMSDKLFKLSISKKDLNHYIAFKYVRPNKSIFNEVFKLNPGHNLIYNFKTNGYQIKRYYKLNLSKSYSKKDFNDIFEKEFNSSIKERLISDVPVGAFLSGGVDSSAVVAFISKYKKNIKTFSVGFDYKKYNESSYAKKVAKKYGTKHHEINFNYKDIENLIYNMPFYFDEPFGDSSQIPTFLVSKVASKHVKVVLGGDSADEIFGGYERYFVYRILSLQRYLPLFLRKCLVIMLNLLYKFSKKIIFTKLIKMINLDKKVYLYKLYGSLISSISNEDFHNLIGEDIDFKLIKPYFNDYHFSKNIQLCDINYYMLEDIFTKVDRSSMANSIEVRSPFTSEKLVELGLNLNNTSKFGLYSGKKCLKKYLERYLPKEILYRSKKGFGVPIAEYFRKELKHLVVEKVIKFDKHNYFNKRFIKEICENHFSAKKDYSSLIWNILMFNLWYEKWMKK
jgi:asparagine synthase (glutamine-hydrolysing)